MGNNLASRAGNLLWFGALSKLQNLLFHTPLVAVFVLGSELYHDYYRWPAKDRAVFEAWQRDTEWGRLFASYGEAKVRARGGSVPQPNGSDTDRPS